MSVEKLSQSEQYWDRLFAPSSSLAMITTVDRDGRVNAGTYGTCTRVLHNPVCIAFATEGGGDTVLNIGDVPQFTVNLPAFDPGLLGKALVVGLTFDRGVNELERAGLTALAAERVRPPRIAECNRHFECEVEWTKQWADGRTMICGRVVAASVDRDCVDDQGYILWEKVRPSHYCGAPYGDMFVRFDQVATVPIQYEGPEVQGRQAHMKRLFES